MVRRHIIAALGELDILEGKDEPTIPGRQERRWLKSEEHKRLIKFLFDHNIPLDPVWEFVTAIRDGS